MNEIFDLRKYYLEEELKRFEKVKPNRNRNKKGFLKRILKAIVNTKNDTN
jgi:hypothetical protein